MKGNSSINKNTVMGHIHGPMGTPILAIGSMINLMDMESISSQTDQGTKVSSGRGSSMVKVLFEIRLKMRMTLFNISDFGNLLCLMEREKLSTKMETNMTENLKEEKGLGMAVMNSVVFSGMRDSGRTIVSMGWANCSEITIFSLREDFKMG